MATVTFWRSYDGVTSTESRNKSAVNDKIILKLHLIKVVMMVVSRL